jgi:hypothetical protein
VHATEAPGVHAFGGELAEPLHITSEAVAMRTAIPEATRRIPPIVHLEYQTVDAPRIVEAPRGRLSRRCL